jgi:hypothetical protein
VIRRWCASIACVNAGTSAISDRRRGPTEKAVRLMDKNC